jgi:hypothetical protein
MPIIENIASFFKPKSMSCCMPHMLQNNNDGAKTSGVQGTMAGKVWFGGVPRDVGTSKVTSVLLFCEHCGRDDGDDGADGGTRKAERNNKYKIIQESMAIRQFYA